jgi:hypothetical protein
VQPETVSMPTFSRVRRKRGPALNWAPTEDSYYEMAQLLRKDARTPLYLTQSAILECEAHLSETSSPLPFGLLAGVVCICPETKVEYLLIDTVCRARVVLAEDDPYAQLAGELRLLASDQAKQRKLAIGWYLGGMADDLTLDRDVESLHRELFPERWQVALVRGRDAGVERGAFLRYEDLWDRWYSIPFLEFLTEAAGHRKGEQRTAIRWANYRTETPARPLEEFEVVAQRASGGTRSWLGARGLSVSLEPFRRAVRGSFGRARERTPATTAPAREELPSMPTVSVVSPATARLAVVGSTNGSQALVAKPLPRREPAPQRPEPTERNVSIPADQTVTAPLGPRPTASVEPRATAAVDPGLSGSAEQSVTRTAELRLAPGPELKVATAAELRVAAPVESNVAAPVKLNVAAPVESRIEAPVEQEFVPPREAKVAREAPQSEVQHIFIDGSLVQAPLAYELPEKPGVLQRREGVRISSIVVGALLVLLLMLLLLYAIAN